MEVEINKNQIQDTGVFTSEHGSLAITPSIDEDYWVFRVHLHEDQYVQAFPKFSTLGIGFAQEEDWNTNLPYVNSSAEEIADHIWHNKKYDEIKKEDLISAIQLLIIHCKKLKEEE